MPELTVLDFIPVFQPFDATQNYFSKKLKQQALISDQIGLLHLTSVMDSYFKYYEDKEERNQVDSLNLEINWLRENDTIFEIEPALTEGFLQTDIGQYFAHNLVEEAKKWNKFNVEVEEILVKYDEKLGNTGDNPDIEDVKKLVKLANSRTKLDELFLRTISIDRELSQKNSVVTALPIENYTDEIPLEKSNVTQVVISKLPLPNNETPWEQIIDYRNDTENRKNILNLRKWIRKVSKENITPTEIEEEIEWLMNEFENHMKLHKMRANTETLEVIVKAPLEFMELKFSKIIDPFFSLKKRQINLLEAEMNAPGREMAYIIKARDTFQSDE